LPRSRRREAMIKSVNAREARSSKDECQPQDDSERVLVAEMLM